MSLTPNEPIDYPNQIKVIGFDLDQTLYPKSPEIDDAIQIYLYEKTSRHQKISLASARQKFKQLYHDEGLSGSKSLEKLDIPDAKYAVQEALEKANIAKFLEPDPATILLLKNIKQQYFNMDIITGSNDQNAHKKLQRMTIPSEIFSHIITGSHGPKSDGTTYRRWLAEYPQFTPDQFLYIGDRAASDYYIPLELGIHSMLVYVSKPDKKISCPQLTSLKDIATILL